MKRILVTGANKGIGLAIVQALLQHHTDTFVLLGSRDLERGEQAMRALLDTNAAWQNRVDVVQLDVTDDISVRNAADSISQQFGQTPLYGLVNNAGTWAGGAQTIIDVNTNGPRRVCDAFVDLIENDGRVVNVSSAAGPTFIAKSDPQLQQFLTNPDITWAQIAQAIHDYLTNSAEDSGSDYGFSKACLNAYTLLLAKQFPRLRVNACTPGFIETDLTRPFAKNSGMTPAQMGMKPPAAGTVSTMFLLLGDPKSGHYYGSDAVRSPLDRYRAPGDPPYTGA